MNLLSPTDASVRSDQVKFSGKDASFVGLCPGLFLRTLWFSLALLSFFALDAAAQSANAVSYRYDSLNRLTQADLSDGTSIAYS